MRQLRRAPVNPPAGGLMLAGSWGTSMGYGNKHSPA